MDQKFRHHILFVVFKMMTKYSCCFIILRPLSFLCFSTHNVVECIMFWAVHPPRTFVRTDLVPAMSHERLEQSQWNLLGIFTSPYYLYLEVKGQGHSRPHRWRRHPRRRSGVKIHPVFQTFY